MHKNLDFYGGLVAGAIEKNSEFKTWFLQQTPFAKYAQAASVLNKCQKEKRTDSATNWWRYHFVEKGNCFCGNCGGGPTDFLCIFQTTADFRFALHIKVAASSGESDFAKAYKLRANCWKGRDTMTPEAIVPHDDAATMLWCKQSEPLKTSNFDSALSFCEIVTKINSYPSNE